MTILAQRLGNIIRERGGFLPSHDNWLEEKASELRQMNIRTIIELFISWNGEDNPIDIANIDSAIEYINKCMEEQQ
jgi:hypothetical protein